MLKPAQTTGHRLLSGTTLQTIVPSIQPGHEDVECRVEYPDHLGIDNHQNGLTERPVSGEGPHGEVC